MNKISPCGCGVVFIVEVVVAAVVVVVVLVVVEVTVVVVIAVEVVAAAVDAEVLGGVVAFVDWGCTVVLGIEERPQLA